MELDDALFETGEEALKAVGEEDGLWNWCLVGADEKNLHLAGGGSGFLDEMRECLQAHGDAVLFGMVRLTFMKGENQGDARTFKWVLVFATLDEGSTMSAVQRGKALAKRPAMEKVLKNYANYACTIELTCPNDLTNDIVVERVKKVAVLDGEMMIPTIPTYSRRQAVVTDSGITMGAEEESKPSDAPEIIEEVYEPGEPVAPPEPTPPEPAAAEVAAEPDKPAEAETAAETEPDKPAVPEQFQSAKIADAPQETTPASEAAPAPEAPEAAPAQEPETAGGEEAKTPGAAKRSYQVGDLVDIWSHTEAKWFTDGIIEEVREKASTTHEGKPLPAGCAKIVYNQGSRGKWLQPEALMDRSVVKPSIRPAPFTGFLKKETHNILSEWHNRYFELKDGYLTWWITLDDARSGVKPQTSLELVGLQMKAPAQSQKFSIRTASSKGVVYNFDAATGAGYHPVEEWAAALKQHAAYANRMHKFRLQGHK